MALDSVRFAQADGCWGIIATLAQADGSLSHPALAKLAAPRTPVRDIADAVHLIGMLHGRQPGIIDHALARAAQPAAESWLEVAAEAFSIERAYLARLASAAGPLPSTPGQAESEAAVSAQRHALDMLAQSDRMGCATGGAVALVLDWMAIRVVLDAAAERFSIAIPVAHLPDVRDTATMVGALAGAPALERAMAFGVQQILAQHRGLWDLIEARASARGDN
jgi:hypothetical protein